MDRWYNEESTTQESIAVNDWMQRREFFKLGITIAGALGTGVGFSSIAAAAQSTTRTSGPLDAASEAKKIAFDRIGNGEKVLLISGFPQTRRSWNRLIPLLSPKFQTIPTDLPSFGDSGFLSASATTENVARVFHAFVSNLGAPLHVVAHDFGAWCAYSWALLFPGDFKSLTLIEAGIPGVTLLNDIQLSDYKRRIEANDARDHPVLPQEIPHDSIAPDDDR
jgi:pimeloyl-ACP methyl ester carboxylesterase